MAKQPDLMILCLAIGPAGDVYAGTGTTIWRSANAGESWTNINPPRPQGVTSLAVNSAGDLVAGTANGYVFRLPADSATWTSIRLPKLGEVTADHRVTSLAFTPSGVTLTGTAGNGLNASADIGARWRQLIGSWGQRDVQALAYAAGGYLSGSG